MNKKLRDILTILLNNPTWDDKDLDDCIKEIILEFLKEIASKVPKEHRTLMYNKKVSNWASVWTFLMNEGKQLEGENK